MISRESLIDWLEQESSEDIIVFWCWILFMATGLIGGSLLHSSIFAVSGMLLSFLLIPVSLKLREMALGKKEN